MKGEIFLEMRGIKKSFGNQVVLRGVDLDVRRGEVLVLLGGSGGGKSVLMKHMVGLLQPDEGTVTLEGKVISDLSERDLSWARKKISMMFQSGALFDSMTVAENVAFPMQEAGLRDRDELSRRVSEALEIVHLEGQEDKMPATLSGGMRKRVALARAVVEEPCCVLYDEPHAGLDPVTGDSIDRLIKDLANEHGITNVVITHEMRSAFRIADRLVFMKDGLVYWEGTPGELKACQDPVLVNFVEGRSQDSDL
ncbi:MAG: ATP-binding cassette domain-containing protein [Verrucomicrobia bacterium]|jgi:phospholipid/cholesterol/gamma-HCH transport system ATP-binding protein|nr:ATP-binding cassette domain-containing protein [Verrucomicrobiota bacterium]MDA7607753.1 ATP-binding cassette domain-containing protein [Akkermansiaceae bacterium]MDB4683381.1 ATP-binding cassette domain-containing protein [bacterium]MBT6399631.1 ATP-binding cassette domain-containing protein [Verrucomicrobiota bacterium]MBT7969390.1 ATP-binding cassette domain-containing protein [Verrucomicrobiota bacterium]